MTGIAAATKSLEILKQLNSIDKRLNEAEYKLKIAELYTSLAEIKITLSDAKQLLHERDAEIASLKHTADFKMQVIRYRGYSFGIENGQSIGRPFCPTCEKSGQQIQIQKGPGRMDFCPKCKAPYGKDYPYRLPENLKPQKELPQE